MRKVKLSSPCQVCVRIRFFLIGATPLLAMILFNVPIDESTLDVIGLFTQLEYVTAALLIAVAALAGWKFWREQQSSDDKR